MSREPRHVSLGRVGGEPARTAGQEETQHAAAEFSTSAPATTEKVIGSVVVTPKRSARSILATGSATANPTTTPADANLIPSPTTSLTMSARCAPSARRIPNSRVRWLVEKLVTPYTPAIASRRVTNGTHATTKRLNRCTT